MVYIRHRLEELVKAYLCVTGSRDIIELYCYKCDTSIKYKKLKSAVHCQNCKTKFTVFRCLKCNKAYDNHTGIINHISSSCKTRRFYCFVCDFTALTRWMIDNHFESVHSNIDLKNVRHCTKCGKIFKNLMLLRVHFKTCGNKPNFSCDLCPYKSRYKGNLRNYTQSFHRRRQTANGGKGMTIIILVNHLFFSTRLRL